MALNRIAGGVATPKMRTPIKETPTKQTPKKQQQQQQQQQYQKPPQFPQYGQSMLNNARQEIEQLDEIVDGLKFQISVRWYFIISYMFLNGVACQMGACDWSLATK